MKKTTYRHLSLEQRYQISALLLAQKSKAFIARELGVARSTITRELARNSTHSAKPPDKYKPRAAQNFADHRTYRRPPVKSTDPDICRRLHLMLPTDWSPEQIANTCKKQGIAMLSTESIYQWIYKQRDTPGGIDYIKHLRQRHRKTRKRRLRKDRRVIIKNKVSIHQRPEVVNEGARIGDLEVDLVKCTNGYLLTATDRKSLFNFIVSIPNKEAGTVQQALTSALLPYKGKLFTITSDNGTEFVRHKEVAQALGIDWYFADPYCSQQRGCNENQNGLIRQYFPSHFDLVNAREGYVQWAQNNLNHRPRKKNNFIAPNEIFFKLPTVALAA